MKKLILNIAMLAASGIASLGAQPMTLTRAECRSMALAHNEKITISENSLKQAELDRKIATTAYLPKFEGSATGVYMLPDMDMMGSKMRMRRAYS